MRIKVDANRREGRNGSSLQAIKKQETKRGGERGGEPVMLYEPGSEIRLGGRHERRANDKWDGKKQEGQNDKWDEKSKKQFKEKSKKVDIYII